MPAAIMTKFLGPTTHRGARIKAWTHRSRDDVPSVTIPYPYGMSGIHVHAAAAWALVEQCGWDDCTKLQGAETDVGYAFVWVHPWSTVTRERVEATAA